MDTCYCKCGTTYRSKSVLKLQDGKPTLITETLCPKCKEFINNCYRISSDVEPFYIKEGE